MMTMNTDITYSDWVRANQVHVRFVIHMGATKAAVHEAECDICKRGAAAMNNSILNSDATRWARIDTPIARRRQP